MKKIQYLAVSLLAVLLLASQAFAQEQGQEEKKSGRSKLLGAQPVNVNTAGGGSLPKGKFLTVLNASFANKTKSKKGSKATDTFAQTWLLKFRYGITNHLEASVTVPYIHMKRGSSAPSPRYTEGFGDTTAALVIAPWNEHQGDPVSASVYVGFFLPTGIYGDNHLPGNGAWGGRYAAGIGKWLTPDFKVDTEVVWAVPFESGNRHLKRGQQFQWNSNIRYLFDSFDIGLESTLVHQESGDRWTSAGKVDTRNGYTEWFVGPSMNFAIEPLGMWAGVGVFLPVMQDVKGPSKVEEARFEFKLGKVW